MRSWQRTATFLAFALVVGVVVFAGRHSPVFSTAGSETKLATAGN
jgi:hypothetical protein